MLSPTLPKALKDGFGKAVVAYDSPKPCRFSSLDSCQNRLLQAHKEVDLAPHPVVRLVLQVADAERFPQAFGFKGLDLVFSVSKQGLCFTAIEEDGGNKRLVQLEHAVEAHGIAQSDPV